MVAFVSDATTTQPDRYGPGTRPLSPEKGPDHRGPFGSFTDGSSSRGRRRDCCWTAQPRKHCIPLLQSYVILQALHYEEDTAEGAFFSPGCISIPTPACAERPPLPAPCRPPPLRVSS